MTFETMLIEKDYGPYITVTDDSINFKLQSGPIKEVGLNGCQVDDMIKFTIDVISIFNIRHTCRENAIVITKLQEAVHWLDHRTKDRIKREAEGYSVD